MWKIPQETFCWTCKTKFMTVFIRHPDSCSCKCKEAHEVKSEQSRQQRNVRKHEDCGNKPRKCRECYQMLPVSEFRKFVSRGFPGYYYSNECFSCKHEQFTQVWSQFRRLLSDNQ